MVRRAAIVHVVPSLVPVFNELTSELLPDVHVLHLADEGLLKELRSVGRLTEELGERLAMLARYAQEYGAEVVMFNCSSLSPLVDSVKERVRVPVFPVDEAMADRAVESGKSIGVLATLQNTLGPTSDLIRRRAALKGTNVEVEAVLCEGAFDALAHGETEVHDRIIREHLAGLSERVEVVALAQASMARVAARLPESERGVPILSSPRPGVERLREMLDSLST
jgi:Asp/Glu/hydantoin racemase